MYAWPSLQPVLGKIQHIKCISTPWVDNIVVNKVVKNSGDQRLVTRAANLIKLSLFKSLLADHWAGHNIYSFCGFFDFLFFKYYYYSSVELVPLTFESNWDGY